MKKNLKYGLILLTICGVCAFALGYINDVTQPVIEQQELENKMQALEYVSNGWAVGEQQLVEDDDFVSYLYPLSEDGETKGYILGLRGSGYGGALTLVASYTVDGTNLAAKMLTNSETPGLGKKSEDEGYMDKFKGTGAERPVPTTKSMLSDDDAAAVSGASVTFAGVGKAIAGGSEFVKRLGGTK
jgi:electron transport complex protein RnfG